MYLEKSYVILRENRCLNLAHVLELKKSRKMVRKADKRGSFSRLSLWLCKTTNLECSCKQQTRNPRQLCDAIVFACVSLQPHTIQKQQARNPRQLCDAIVFACVSFQPHTIQRCFDAQCFLMQRVVCMYRNILSINIKCYSNQTWFKNLLGWVSSRL